MSVFPLPFEGRPAIADTVESGLYIRHMTFTRAGMAAETHRHTYGHVTQFIAGRFWFWSEIYGVREVVCRGLVVIDIPKNTLHAFQSLVDGSVSQCIHVMRYADGTEVPFDAVLTHRQILEITAEM